MKMEELEWTRRAGESEVVRADGTLYVVLMCHGYTSSSHTRGALLLLSVYPTELVDFFFVLRSSHL